MTRLTSFTHSRSLWHLCWQSSRPYINCGVAVPTGRSNLTSYSSSSSFYTHSTAAVAVAAAATTTAAYSKRSFSNCSRLSQQRRTLSILPKSEPSTNMSSSLYGDDTPDSIKNSKGLHLVTQSTPNGQKVQILLEELKQVYGTEWDTTLINIGTNEQKKDWFLRLDPNGRIPILVDNTVSPPFTAHETSAELLYLAGKYDKKHEFTFADPLEENLALQWLFFWHGSGAPYQGQTNHFTRAAPEKIPYAITRFRNETLRVYGVLEIRLSGKYTGEPREYLAGPGTGKYSVADIGTWPWVKGWKMSGFTDEELAEFPHLLKWIDRIAARPAVKIGISEKYSKDSTDPSVSKWKL